MDIHCLELSNALFIYRSSVGGDDNILTNTYVYEMLVSSATKFNEFLFVKTSHHIFKNVSTHWMATAMTTLFCPILGCFMQCTPISFIQLSTCAKRHVKLQDVPAFTRDAGTHVTLTYLRIWISFESVCAYTFACYHYFVRHTNSHSVYIISYRIISYDIIYPLSFLPLYVFD